MINEIHYHPPPIISGINLIDDTITEFIGIYNISDSTVRSTIPSNTSTTAYATPTAARIRGEFEVRWSFDFPEGATLGAGSSR